MAFSFGFSGDDIEEDPNDVQEQGQQQTTTDSNVPPPVPAKTHDPYELVGTRFEILSRSGIIPRSPTLLSHRDDKNIPTSDTNKGSS